MENTRKIPTHVAIIMDGNGRWAKARGKERVYGHKHGLDSVKACIEAAGKAGVRYLSLFAFSEENWNRPVSEVETLMKLMLSGLREQLGDLIKNQIRLIFLGHRDRLSVVVNKTIDEVMRRTASYDRLTVVVFLSYSGKWDILQASRRIARDVAQGRLDADAVDMDTFGRYLVTAGIPEPDLLIRTSGEQRISNFLLWQLAYTELYFTDIMWPDFRQEAFNAALESYALRDRRYGKV